MRFEQFAQAHGLLMRDLIPGRWVRVPTNDHPRTRNGAYKYLGEVGWVQNHATMTEPATWFADKDSNIRIDQEAIRRAKDRADKELQEGRAKAAKKAGWMLRQARMEKHTYLSVKGFPDATGLVFESKLVIPMRVGRELVGVQTISEGGEKKFLFGQRTSGAEFVIDNKGADWWCEGYATGLSLRAVLHALKVRYRIHICFSAGNMQKLARTGYVIADNDESGTGQRSAEATGLPYWIPPAAGTDMNDRHIDVGLFRLSQDVRKWLQSLPERNTV